MKIRKFLAKLLVVAATFFVVLSPIVLVEEASHNCNHEDCQICEVIRTAEENFKHTININGGAEAALLIAVSFVIVFSLLAISFENKVSNTPITLKNKITN